MTPGFAGQQDSAGKPDFIVQGVSKMAPQRSGDMFQNPRCLIWPLLRGACLQILRILRLSAPKVFPDCGA
jgi:hypothetical protein